MFPQTASRNDVTFLSVALKGVFRVLFLILIAFIVSMVAVAVYLGGMTPQKYQGEIEYARFDIVIPELTEPPLTMMVSHDYPIEAQPFGYYITDGPDLIEFRVAVCNTRGEAVFEKSSSLIMPDTISAYRGHSEYTVSEELFMDLPPGTYHLFFRSSHPLKYSIVQDYKYELPKNASIGLAALGLLLLAGVAIGALKKRDSLRNQRSFALFSGSNYGLVTEPGAQPGYAPALVPAYGQPAFHQPSMEEPVDYICAKCGNLIQNPVVQNVITCEKCGEKEYVG